MNSDCPPHRIGVAVIALSLTALTVGGCVKQPDPTIPRDTDTPTFSEEHALTQSGRVTPSRPKRFSPDIFLDETAFLGLPIEPVEPDLQQLLERIRASQSSSQRQTLMFTYVQHAGELPPEEREKAFAALEQLFQ